MNKEFGRLCATARNKEGLTQETAAELFGVSVRSISDYENGKTAVPDDIVRLMVKHYHASWLGYLYLQQTSDVGKEILPQVEIKELSQSILDLQVKMKKANDIQFEIAEVGADNIIDRQEEPVYIKCMDVVKLLIGSAMALTLAPLTPINKKFLP